jgi:transcriptional regulator with XRE-family HTH domain
VANERLRQAISQAGLEPEQLADQIEVDVKTVQRWLAGRTPHPRLRARLARALGREEHELWPDVATEPADDSESRGEIQGAWAHADDEGVPDWQELLDEAVDRVELLGYSLIAVVSVDGVIDTLAEKGNSGARVRILISAPDSIWVTATAQHLGQQDDYIGRSQLQLEIETARAHLESLTDHLDVDVRQFYADPGYTILRFDNQMLVIPRLHGIPAAYAPLLHLRRQGDGGLFDQFEAHLAAIVAQASEPIHAARDAYPNPNTHPERYQPLDKARYDQELEAGRERYTERAETPTRPIEEVRAELRRTDQPDDATPPD